MAEETRVPRENHRPAASHRQTLSHNIVSKKLEPSAMLKYVLNINFTYNSNAEL
jgi:hypothetical protein